MKVQLINNRHFHGGGADVVYFTTGELLESDGHEYVYFSNHSDEAEQYKLESFFALICNIGIANSKADRKKVFMFI